MTEEVLNELYETAIRMSRGSSRPVDVRRICKNLGITITRKTLAKSEGLRKRAFLLESGECTEIALPESSSNSSEFTTWERFLIAHELGHYFLSRLRVSKPLGSREYWQIEKVCDRFARLLLLPAEEVSTVVSISRTSAVELLGATLHLQVTWDVPWPVAAHEVAACVKTAHFFKVVSDGGRFCVRASTLPDKRRTGRRICAESSVGRLLSQLPPASRQPHPVAPSELPAFEAFCAATDAAVWRSRRGEYRIATIVR